MKYIDERHTWAVSRQIVSFLSSSYPFPSRITFFSYRLWNRNEVIKFFSLPDFHSKSIFMTNGYGCMIDGYLRWVTKLSSLGRSLYTVGWPRNDTPRVLQTQEREIEQSENLEKTREGSCRKVQRENASNLLNFQSFFHIGASYVPNGFLLRKWLRLSVPIIVTWWIEIGCFRNWYNVMKIREKVQLSWHGMLRSVSMYMGLYVRNGTRIPRPWRHRVARLLFLSFSLLLPIFRFCFSSFLSPVFCSLQAPLVRALLGLPFNFTGNANAVV